MRRTGGAISLCALVAVAAACGGGGSGGKSTPADRDCAAVITAARALPIVDPAHVTPQQADAAATAASRLQTAAGNATTAVAVPARKLGDTARLYADALGRHNVERAVTTQGLLRQQAAPIAQACGESPARVLGP